jgi:hypothetical protein
VRCAGGREFALTPRVLRLGFSDLSSLDPRELAEPLLAELGERTALTICGHAGRVTVDQLHDEFLPQLLRAASDRSDPAASAEPTTMHWADRGRP